MRLFDKIAGLFRSSGLFIKNRKGSGRLSLYAGIAFGLLMLSGCVDDINLKGDIPKNDVEIEGDCLAFTIQLDKALSSRDMNIRNHVEEKDNWIDTQDKFRVFFFTEWGDFLFGANDRIVGTLENVGLSNYDYWYVRIPMEVLVDREGAQYDTDKIKDYLKNHKFKIAVLANWPNAGEKVNPGDYDDSVTDEEGNTTNNNFSTNPSSSLKGDPLWGWKNSILNKDAEAEDIKNINDLHHLYDESKGYADATGSYPKKDAYGPFLGKNDDENWAMGVPTEWVKMRDIHETGEYQGWKYPNGKEVSSAVNSFESKETANAWIRENWNPNLDLNENKEIYRHYQHLWFLWNFDAIWKMGYALYSYPNALPSWKQEWANQYYGDNLGWNDGNTTTMANPWGLEWWERNGEEIFDAIGYNSQAIPSFETAPGEANDEAFFKFKTVEGAHTVTSNGMVGIYLPKATGLDNSNYVKHNVTDEGSSEGFFKFIARTSGTLRMKVSAPDGEAKIRVQKEGSTDKNYTIPGDGKVYEIDGTQDLVNGYRDLSIGDDSKPIYIFSYQNPIIVYGIEYVRGKYLYDTDREGIYPTEEQGIPMYGIKEYSPINWEDGTTHTLPGNVSMIRALAKIELFIPKSFGVRPNHVYMRSMNRSARCEPMDVETDTDLLWKEASTGHTSLSAGNCEWFHVQRYGTCFEKDKEDKVAYRKWLSWFYGSWKNTKWKNNRHYDTNSGYWVVDKTNGWSFDAAGLLSTTELAGEEKGSKEYPRIFNSHIIRSDFCSMLYVGEAGDNYKYVLYMPEKNIDDPSNVGIVSSAPKVPHIEYRFPPLGSFGESVEADIAHPEFNLDDNYCYRVYFTDYSNNSAIKSTPLDGFDYQKDGNSISGYETTSNMSKHWPVMRNHIYQFYVVSNGKSGMNVHVKVLDWKYDPVILDW